MEDVVITVDKLELVVILEDHELRLNPREELPGSHLSDVEADMRYRKTPSPGQKLRVQGVARLERCPLRFGRAFSERAHLERLDMTVGKLDVEVV
jgi:hypothetical protein